jgi:O-antigen/teichoic acid export membrane protein
MRSSLKLVKQNLSPGLRKIIGNVSWLLAEQAFNMLLSLFVGIYVVRYLGPDNYGKLSYSYSFVGLFAAFAKLGLDRIVIRNLVKGKDSDREIVGTAFVLKLIGSLLTIGLIVIAVFNFSNDPQNRWMTSIISIGLLFDSFEAIDFWFQSKVRSAPMAKARSLQLTISSLLKLMAIALKLPVIAFACLFAIDYLIKAFTTIWAYWKQDRFISQWLFSFPTAINLMKDSWPLILSAVMVTIYLKIDQVMLGNMVGDREVGKYAAAIRFSEIWYFVPTAICSSVFPAIIQAKQKSEKEYKQRLQQLYDLMAWISLSIAIPMTFVSGYLITTLLGKEYIESAPILALHIWAGLFVFLGLASNQWLMTENFTQFSFATTSLGALTNVFLNLYLIPLYGGIGAALATVISYAVSTHIACIFYPPMYQNCWMLTKALFVPFRFRQNQAYLNLARKKLGFI